MIALALALAAATPSVQPCRVAFVVAVMSESDHAPHVHEVIDKYMLDSHFTPAEVAEQNALCSAYFQGQADVLDALSPEK